MQDSSFYEILFDQIPLGILIGKEGNFVYVNNSFMEMFGYSSKDELIGKSIEIIYPRRIREAQGKKGENRFAGIDEDLNYDTVGLKKDETEFPINIIVSQIEINGSMELVGYYSDITDRINTQNQVKTSSAQYQALFNSAPQGIIVLQDGIIKLVNTQLLHTFGYHNAEDLIEESIKFITAPEVSEHLYQRSLNRQKGEKEPNIYETLGIRRNGKIFPMQIKVDRIKLESEYGVIAYVEDITERKAFQEELIANEKRFRSIFSNASLGIVLADTEGQMIQSNQKFQDIVGYSTDELREIQFMDITHKDDVDKNTTLWNTILDGETDRYIYQKRYIRKDGTIIPVNISVSAIKNTQGSIVYSIALIEDATDAHLLKETQLQLKSKEEQLLRAQKMESIARISGGIAHDINNMLTGILGYISLIELGEGEDAPEYIEGIKRIVDQSAEMSSRLLTFSRQRINRPEIMDLNKIIQDMEKMIGQLLAPRISFNLFLDNKIRPIYMDINHFQQIVMNMVLNAKDAMPEGGTLTIQTIHNPQLRLPHSDDIRYFSTEVNQSSPFAELTISDTGIGIDEEGLSQIFEPFYTTKEHGTGLGLATVYGVIEENHGIIDIASQEGKGTSFSIFFPVPNIEAGHQSDQSEVTIISDEALKSQKIVLVDDNDDVRNVLNLIMRQMNLEVYSVANSQEALVQIEHLGGDIDLLLTDMVMPGMMGDELAKQVNRLYPRIKIVIMTGYHQQNMVFEKLEHLPFTILEKPFDHLKLKEVIRQILN